MEPKRNYTNINSNSLQSLITQICARSKSLSIFWNFLKTEVAKFFEDAAYRLSNILPMAFRTYRPWPFAHTPARNICGRSKLSCWRHRCTVRGSTSGAVYTSYIRIISLGLHLPLILLSHSPFKKKSSYQRQRDSRANLYDKSWSEFRFVSTYKLPFQISKIILSFSPTIRCLKANCGWYIYIWMPR